MNEGAILSVLFCVWENFPSHGACLCVQYFTGRLKDASLDHLSANETDVADDHRSELEAKFNNVMTLCAMLPLLLFTCLNSLLHSL